MSEAKSYLGDGVYVDLEHGMVKLTTEDGYSATNTIYLGDRELDALERWLKRAREAAARSVGALLIGCALLLASGCVPPRPTPAPVFDLGGPDGCGPCGCGARGKAATGTCDL